MKTPRAVYLAIGTELTSGQITNRNASWISSRLEAAGIPVTWHLCVPDDRALMREAMELASSRGEVIFITGGLGPTTDDFTREVVAEWWARRLEWHEPSWTKAVERLAKRGIRAPESGKQQAWYPQGATVLSNREGTADGFLLERLDAGQKQSVFVLPGPPREIEAIWEDHIAHWIQERFSGLRPIEPLRWSVLGKSESQLGDLVEEAVKGSGLLTGYRATPPYVEIKIWIPHGLDSQSPSVLQALERLESAIGEWVVTRGEEDGVQRFFDQLKALKQSRVTLVDSCTPGLLSERIWSWARLNPLRMRELQSLGLTVVTGDVSQASDAFRVELGPLQQRGLDARVRARFQLTGAREFHVQEFEIPFPSSMPERQWLLAVEKLLMGSLPPGLQAKA